MPAYSASRNSAKRRPVYSVYAPKMISESATGMSKGGRWSSARPATKKTRAPTICQGSHHHSKASRMPGSETVPAAMATEAAVSSIGSSYARSWAAVRRPPRRENLLAEAQPAMSEPRTPTPITASTKKMPASTTWPTAPSPGPIGMARRTRRYGRRATAGASWKIRRSAPAGTMSSFCANFTPSATSWAQPWKPPAYIGPRRPCMWAITLCSVCPTTRGKDEEDDEDDEQPQGDVESVVHAVPPAGSFGVVGSVAGSGVGLGVGRFGRLGRRASPRVSGPAARSPAVARRRRLGPAPGLGARAVRRLGRVERRAGVVPGRVRAAGGRRRARLGGRRAASAAAAGGCGRRAPAPAAAARGSAVGLPAARGRPRRPAGAGLRGRARRGRGRGGCRLRRPSPRPRCVRRRGAGRGRGPRARRAGRAPPARRGVRRGAVGGAAAPVPRRSAGAGRLAGRALRRACGRGGPGGRRRAARAGGAGRAGRGRGELALERAPFVGVGDARREHLAALGAAVLGLARLLRARPGLGDAGGQDEVLAQRVALEALGQEQGSRCGWP